MTEVYSTLENVMGYYGTRTKPMAQIPFNFFLLIDLNYNSNATMFAKTINYWMDNMPRDQWPNWVVSSMVLKYILCVDTYKIFLNILFENSISVR